MHKLTHYRLCPRSRAIRLALAELAIAFEGAEIKPWALDEDFLTLNPAGELPVLELDSGALLSGVYAIAEYLNEESEARDADGPIGLSNLIPGDREARAEVRRLCDWFIFKMDREVTRELLIEKIYARQDAVQPQAPDAEFLRAIHSNLRYHLSYVNYLAHQRSWLAGDELSFADLAAAAQLSSADYMGEVPWEAFPVAKDWYQRLKSRPSFRPLLQDRIAGMPPPLAYSDLDF